MLVGYCVCVCKIYKIALYLLRVLRNSVTCAGLTSSVRTVKYRRLQWPRHEARKEAKKQGVQNIFAETSWKTAVWNTNKENRG